MSRFFLGLTVVARTIIQDQATPCKIRQHRSEVVCVRERGADSRAEHISTGTERDGAQCSSSLERKAARLAGQEDLAVMKEHSRTRTTDWLQSRQEGQRGKIPIVAGRFQPALPLSQLAWYVQFVQTDSLFVRLL